MTKIQLLLLTAVFLLTGCVSVLRNRLENGMIQTAGWRLWICKRSALVFIKLWLTYGIAYHLSILCPNWKNEMSKRGLVLIELWSTYGIDYHIISYHIISYHIISLSYAQNWKNKTSKAHSRTQKKSKNFRSNGSEDMPSGHEVGFGGRYRAESKRSTFSLKNLATSRSSTTTRREPPDDGGKLSTPILWRWSDEFVGYGGKDSWVMDM